MVPASVSRRCRPQGHGGFIDRGTHPRPAGCLCYELTDPILHLPPPPVTFTPSSPREQGEAGQLPPQPLAYWSGRAQHSESRAAEGACPDSVLSAWAQLVFSQGSWLPLVLMAVPPAGRLETVHSQY